MPRKKSVITEKQQVFADTMLETGSVSAATRAAGYSPTGGTLASRTQGVQEALRIARDELENVSTLRRVDVLNMFLEAIEMARTLADPSQMINGADKVAKMMGYYAPETKRIELTTDQSNIAKKLETLSDAELLEMLQKRSLLIDAPNDDEDLSSV